MTNTGDGDPQAIIKVTVPALNAGKDQKNLTRFKAEAFQASEKLRRWTSILLDLTRVEEFDWDGLRALLFCKRLLEQRTNAPHIYIAPSGAIRPYFKYLMPYDSLTVLR